MAMIYFTPGDEVKLKQDKANPPVMIIKKAKKGMVKDAEGKVQLIGMICYWFTSDGTYQEQVFNTKDLIHI